MTSSLKDHVQKLLEEHRGERVFRFKYFRETLLVKATRAIKRIWLLIKTISKTTFLKEECEILQHLNNIGAPVPKLCGFGDDYLVLEDAGPTLNIWLNDETLSWAEKSHILHSAIEILINLHQQGIIHGRPAIRDIAWKDGKISFMDFESHSKSHNEHWLITRDMLAFLDSLCRVKGLDDEKLNELFDYYKSHCPTTYWVDMLSYV